MSYPINILLECFLIRDSVAYFTEDSIKRLCSIDDIPHLSNMFVPHDDYKSSRSAKGKADHMFSPRFEPEFSRIEYVPYKYRCSHTSRLQAPSSPPQYPHTWPKSPLQPESSPDCSHPRQGPGSSTSLNDSLAPLEYLQNIQPLRRHPIDEKALMRFHFTGHL